MGYGRVNASRCTGLKAMTAEVALVWSVSLLLGQGCGNIQCYTGSPSPQLQVQRRHFSRVM